MDPINSTSSGLSANLKTCQELLKSARKYGPFTIQCPQLKDEEKEHFYNQGLRVRDLSGKTSISNHAMLCKEIIEFKLRVRWMQSNNRGPLNKNTWPFVLTCPELDAKERQELREEYGCKIEYSEKEGKSTPVYDGKRMKVTFSAPDISN